MDKDEICESVKNILRKTFPAATLTQPFDAIEGMDSLDYVCFISDVEAQFDVKIPRDTAADFESPLALCEWLERHL